jgi:dolichol-phosphate mannosyltransferase
MVDHGLSVAPRPAAFAAQVVAVPLGRRRASGLWRMLRFGIVGAVGTVVNLAVMAGALHLGVHYVLAAVLAAEVSIVGNFLLQERFVFADGRHGQSWVKRFVQAVSFNNLEALLRLPVLIALVEFLLIQEVAAQAMTLAVAFLLRFWFMNSVVYGHPSRPGR